MTTDPPDAHDPRKLEVIATVKAINQAWLAGRWDDLAMLLDQHVVATSPNPGERAEGREACIASYQDFASQASIGWFEDRDWQVDLNGDVAVASYWFELSYEMRGEMHSEAGREIWVMRRDAVGWTGFWRTITQGEDD